MKLQLKSIPCAMQDKIAQFYFILILIQYQRARIKQSKEKLVNKLAIKNREKYIDSEINVIDKKIEEKLKEVKGKYKELVIKG